MSTFDANDLETRGYFLPENSQLGLQKLRDYVEFLSHVAQPRTPDAEHEGIPEINAEQVAICRGFLAEQLGLVLNNLSFSAYRSEREAEPGAYAKPEAAEAMPYDTGERYRFGITLDQVDTLNQLIDMIVAHGDVVTASQSAELADHTLSLLGHAIFNDARAVRDIIRLVESQCLNPPRHSHTGVSEEQGVYEVVQKPSRAHGITSASTGQMQTLPRKVTAHVSRQEEPCAYGRLSSV
ncbi:hypothetical protein HDE78_004149 [Rhodanobacter sp. K2T2]|uniref:XAC0095 family protein n=1 Tax=Rhodanobacter sp. K2T2 TaxID=2723085 RepID=UPI0015C6E7C6|nr:hypothetical protein [Rhodanobacter sp. K2T2]NYE31166.1 hypothetical protein [Rhodanobacter sp. K2T2]